MSDGIAVALRELNGQGPLEVMLREKDFNVLTLKDPETEQSAPIPATSCITFDAQGFREVTEPRADTTDPCETGTFEFRIREQSDPKGPPVFKNLIVRSQDILLFRVLSRVAL